MALIAQVAAAALVGFLAVTAHAQEIVYYDSRGFEEPTYRFGALAGQSFADGQDLWVGQATTLTPPFFPEFSRMAVQGNRVRSGVAAGKFDAAGHPQAPGVRLELTRGSFFTVVEPVMQLDADLFLEGSAAPSERWVLTLQQDPLIPLTSWTLLANGQMTGDDWTTGLPVALSGFFARDAWHHVRVLVDYPAQTVVFVLDGTPIGQVGFPAVGSLGLVGFFVQGRGADALYFDNLRIVNHDGAAQCPADFNGDGFVTGQDFDDFVIAFEAGDPSSDFDSDGFVTGLDFDAFVVAFEEGC